MAHLTRYTFSKLAQKVNITDEITLETFLEFVFDNPRIYYILNKYEVKYLFTYRSLLEDEEKFRIEKYEKVPERKDTQSYVFERAGKLKYHLTDECPSLYQDFVDFNIPPELRTLGDEAVSFFRNWFKSKGYAQDYIDGNLDVTKVVFNYNMTFPPKFQVPVLNENYKLVQSIPNSNQKRVDDSFDHNFFYKKLDEVVNGYYQTFSSPIMRLLAKWDSLIKKSDLEIQEKVSELASPEFIPNFGMDKLKEFFEKSRKIKLEIIKLLIDYFQWNYNLKGKNFNPVTLEHFDLECCGMCEEKIKNNSVIRT